MDLTPFLEEDVGSGDVTTRAVLGGENPQAEAGISARESCVLAGLEEAAWIFSHLGCTANARAGDGERIGAGTLVLSIQGPAASILAGERTALNFLGRMSGIATLTRELVERCRPLNPKVEIAATRKTTPGFRTFEKKAVVLGGGRPHRNGLYDAILIKDNHIWLAGSAEEALGRAKERAEGPVEIEVTTEEDAVRVARMGAAVIMFDNFTPAMVESAAKRVRDIDPAVRIEVSGGINPGNIAAYAPFSDMISLGWLTHSARSVDFSLELSDGV